MPAHTNTESRGRHTDRQASADDTALGLRVPWILSPPGSRFPLPNGVHCSPDSGSGEELSFPRNRLPPSVRWPRPYAGWPPFIESFLLRQIPSCFPAGPRIYTGLSCSAWAPVFLSILPLCPGSVLSPRSRDPGRAPKCFARCPNPRAEERRLPRQCDSQKGKFITDSSQGLLPQPTQWCRVRKSPEQRRLPKFIRYAQAVSSWLKQIGYMFAKQFYWYKLSRAFIQT